jgi:hypothetical protein
VAQTHQRWSTQEVPVAGGDWLELWSDGERARIGYRDGTVYALPSRVRIASPLALVGQQQILVNDYFQLCRVPFAITTNGLYQLQPPTGASVVGEWQRSPDVLQPPFPDNELTRVKAFDLPDEVILVSGTGRAIRILPDNLTNCTPP